MKFKLSINPKKIIPFLTFVLCAIYIFIIIYRRIFVVLNLNAPREYRELASIYFAAMFSRSKNPYSLDLLAQTEPIITNMYGLVSPAIWSIFLRIFHNCSFSSLQVCEFVNILFEIFGIVFTGFIVYKNTNKLWLSSLGALFTYACFWRYSAFAGAFPDQIGVTVSLLLLLIIKLDEKKGKEHTLVYAILSIVLFYIKQYFVISAIGILLYLILNKKIKSAISYCIEGIVFGLISVVAINHFFPLYFTEVLPLAQGQTPSAGLLYSVRQFFYLIRAPFTIFTLAIFIRIVTIRKLPLHDIFCIENIQFLLAIPVVVLIGCNDGTYYTYYLQLLFPYYLILGCSAFNDIFEHCKSYPHYRKKYYIAASIIAILICAKSLQYLSGFVIESSPSSEQILSWKESYDFIDYYQGKGKVLLPAHLSLLNIEKGIYTHEYGQAEFNTESNYDNWNQSKLWHTLFPNTGEIIKKNLTFNSNIINSVKAGSYSCIITVPGSAAEAALLSSENTLYHIDHIEELSTGNQVWETSFWVK